MSDVTVTITRNEITVTPTNTGVDVTVAPVAVTVTTTVGITDHGALSGLSDDDHSQYHNDARGDLRYAQLAAINTFTLSQIIRGHSAIGSAATVDQSNFGPSVPFSTNLGIYETITTHVANTNYVNLAAYQIVNPSQSGVTAFNSAIRADTRSDTANANNIHSITGLTNIAGHAGTGTATTVTGLNTQSAKLSTGAVTTLYGIRNETVVLDTTGTAGTVYGIRQTNTNTGTVTTMYGVHIGTSAGSGTIGTLYGLFIASQDIATATTKYAIWTDGGEVRHKAGAAGVVPLAVQLAASPTADAFRILASDGTTKLAYFDSVGDIFLPTKTANTIFAGPTTGSAARPAFRALVADDLPNTAVTPGSYTNTNLTVDAQGRITAASNGAGGGGGGGTVGGTGTAGRIPQWASDGANIEDSTLAKTGAGVLTLSASGAFTLTVPATGTAALLATANVFTVTQTINTTTTSALVLTSTTNTTLSITASGGGDAIRPTSSSTGIAIRASYSGAAAAAVQQILITSNNGTSGGTNAGARHTFQSRSSTTQNVDQADWTSLFVNGTHASRTNRITGTVHDTASREWIRGEASGSAAMIGFLGANAAPRQTGGAATAGGTYGATEQAMLQTVYDMARTFGFLT